MIKMILIIWLIGLHAFALLAIVDTDLPYRIDRKLGFGWLNPPEITQFYDDTLGSHLQLDSSVEAGSVIFLGDSLTQGLNVAAITNPAINYGIGMDTSLGLLQRIPHYESLNTASTIVLAIGVNDFIRAKRNPEAVIENYQKIIASLPADKKIIINGVLPIDESFGMNGINQKIVELNQSLETLASRQSLTMINLHSQYANASGNLQAEFHIGDGIHLSHNGYKRWIDTLKQTIHP